MLVAGCSTERAKPAPDPIALLRTGQASLTCRDACLREWREAQPRAAQLDATGQWQTLATVVIRTRYQDDLAYYYLGRAAEGLGHHSAAASYYRQSVVLSGTVASCRQLSRLCGGVALPGAATGRLAALIGETNQTPRRRPLRSRRPSGTMLGQPETEAPGLPVYEPPSAAPVIIPPAPSAVPAPPAEAETPTAATIAAPPSPPPRPVAPKPAAADPRAGEFIEPPPASR